MVRILFEGNRKEGSDMKKLTIREVRQALSHLDRLLEIEGEVTITRRGDPIAKVVQVGRKRPIPSHRDLRDGIQSENKAHNPPSSPLNLRGEQRGVTRRNGIFMTATSRSDDEVNAERE
jgi:antitoxin (DNA-binding transcriptional repressor) of toxin-antitoxin stability system